MNEAFLKWISGHPLAVGIFIVVVVAIGLYAVTKAMQKVGMEKVREYVYQLFVEAEHKFLHGENDQKFEYVVSMAKSAIPMPFNLFITDDLVRDVIQLWFDLCKDLLDDGKMNRSTKEETL